MTTINMTTKDDCIEKICNLPLDFKIAYKSSFLLLQESKFADFHNDITKKDIVDYLSRNKNLIDNWKIWSEDKRTCSYYLSLNPNNHSVGSLGKDGKINFSKSFTTVEEACAEFILREVNGILDIKND